MLAIAPLTDQQALADFVHRQPLNPFLQSWAWGEFQGSVGRKIWRLGAMEGGHLVGAALAIEHEILLGRTYLYCPRGPLAERLDVWQALAEELRRVAAQAGAMYLKIDPGHYSFDFTERDFPKGFTPGTTLQPQQTMLIDVARLLPDILESFHSKTRYNIRLAEKKNLTIRWSTDDKDLSIFLELMAHTAKRQHIHLHRDSYYQKLFSTLRAVQMVELVIGEVGGQAEAAHMILWHGQTATYLHGGSRGAHKDMMAPYLLQWRTIERAHERDITKYDLWGIAPDDEPGHKWAGITRFKKGFQGQKIIFPPAANYILQPAWYYSYRLAKKLRGMLDE
ncbi:MAG: peptidoglycan bridge formation glycyltransferase FemA/FemB family protein [Candidatus Kerfeldbacteria bacterium]|nr:peptidoglycan bridge formation glycyltransferase FemA/FemB family protein [Candidatus Kerfeldbacteria bacterium]